METRFKIGDIVKTTSKFTKQVNYILIQDYDDFWDYYMVINLLKPSRGIYTYIRDSEDTEVLA